MIEKTTFEEQLQKKGYLVWTNVGVSMMPLLRENRDLMVIAAKGGQRCKKYDAVLFRRPGVDGRGSYVMHRILRVNPDGTYWIVGDNCFSGEIVREEDVLGILTQVVRDGKTIHVTDRGYLLYMHLWCDAYPVRFFVLRCKNFILRRMSFIKRRVLKIK